MYLLYLLCNIDGVLDIIHVIVVANLALVAVNLEYCFGIFNRSCCVVMRTICSVCLGVVVFFFFFVFVLIYLENSLHFEGFE